MRGAQRPGGKEGVSAGADKTQSDYTLPSRCCGENAHKLAGLSSEDRSTQVCLSWRNPKTRVYPILDRKFVPLRFKAS